MKMARLTRKGGRGYQSPRIAGQPPGRPAASAQVTFKPSELPFSELFAPNVTLGHQMEKGDGASEKDERCQTAEVGLCRVRAPKGVLVSVM